MVITGDMALFPCNLREITASMPGRGDATSRRNPGAPADPGTRDISVPLLAPQPALLRWTLHIQQLPWSHLRCLCIGLQVVFSICVLSSPGLHWEQQHFKVLCCECMGRSREILQHVNSSETRNVLQKQTRVGGSSSFFA